MIGPRQARTARTPRPDRTSRPRRGTDHEPPRPGWTHGKILTPASNSRSTNSPSGRSIATSLTSWRTRARHNPRTRPHRARTSPPGSARPSHQRSAHRASRTPIDARIGTSHENFNSILVRVFTAPRPGGTVADAYRQALKVGLRPVAACGTSPPPRGADPRKALHNGGQALQSPLPAAVEATTSMTYRHCSDAVAGRRAIAFTQPKSRRWPVRARFACSRPVSKASSRDYVWSPSGSPDAGSSG